MFSLYRRRQDGSLEYREAWVNDGEVVEHWGVVGTRGQTRRHKAKSDHEEKALEHVVIRLRAEGFAELQQHDRRTLLVEYELDGSALPGEADRPGRLARRLNDLLAWTGLGSCDGASTGGSALVACCQVVDPEVARKVIEADLSGSEFADFSRIHEEKRGA